MRSQQQERKVTTESFHDEIRRGKTHKLDYLRYYHKIHTHAQWNQIKLITSENTKITSSIRTQHGEMEIIRRKENFHFQNCLSFYFL